MAEVLNTAFILTPKVIDEFMASFSARSKSPSSVYTYQKRLKHFYDLLPTDKAILPETLSVIRSDMIAQGIPNRSINLTISSINSLLEYFKRRDLQLIGSLEQTEVLSPELTRTEYLRLLMAAKALDKERAYLLIKVFVNTGLNSREVPLLTVEAIEAGRIILPERGIVPIPAVICKELSDYCRRNGRYAGTVFTTQAGKPIHRSVINTEIRRLAKDARVDETKCNPMTLRRLFLETREQIMSSLTLLVEQSHERLLETEQLATGWNV